MNLFKYSKAKAHESIHTLPIAGFRKAMQGDLSALIIEGKPTAKALAQAWVKVMNGYLRHFGLPDEYKKYLSLRGKACELWADVYCKGQKWKKPLALMKEAQANHLFDREAKADFGKALAYASKNMGFRVDPNQVTVYEFYSYLQA